MARARHGACRPGRGGKCGRRNGNDLQRIQGRHWDEFPRSRCQGRRLHGRRFSAVQLRVARPTAHRRGECRARNSRVHGVAERHWIDHRRRRNRRSPDSHATQAHCKKDFSGAGPRRKLFRRWFRRYLYRFFDGKPGRSRNERTASAHNAS